MKLKKFMLMNLIFSLILIMTIYLISKVTKYSFEDDLLKFKKYSSFSENSVKIVNVGSSHGKFGLYYLDDKEKMNLARNSQSFYYDLQLLKKYTNKIRQNAIIIIPISIFSFYNHNDENLNERYIQLLKKKAILNIDYKKYFLIKNFSILYPVTNILKIKEKIKNQNKEHQIKYPDDLDINSKIKESQETILRHLGISEIKYSIKNSEDDFINLINYIQERNWHFVLITTPYSYLYNDNIKKYQENAFKERIYNNIKIIEVKLNQKFIYLDYSHDKRFTNNLEYFFDDDHLNEKGAKYFTNILLEDIEKYETANSN